MQQLDRSLAAYERQNGCTRWTEDTPAFIAAERREADRELELLVKKLHSECTQRWMLFDRRNSSREQIGMN